MKKIAIYCIFFLLCVSFSFRVNAQQRTVWTSQTANQWYKTKPWFVGANYITSTAINQLEMWQAETFDTVQIAKELSWAKSIGMNTMRVFLHDLLYQQDAEGFFKRIDQFLAIAKRNGISILFVLFDSCWDPNPALGKQREPRAHVHNSGWVQNPGRKALEDSTKYPRLETYVKAVVKKFATDKRIWGWDIWNEPDNKNEGSYGKTESPRKAELVLKLLPMAFEWARSQNPSQPLTSGIWMGDWSSDEKMSEMAIAQVKNSDVISFHSYANEAGFEQCVKQLQRYKKPIICTEYMARGNNSTFEGTLAVCRSYRVGAINWGFVDGKSQTKYPWDSWDRNYNSEPALWFHDIFRADGTPYRKYEIDFIKKLTGKVK